MTTPPNTTNTSSAATAAAIDAALRRLLGPKEQSFLLEIKPAMRVLVGSEVTFVRKRSFLPPSTTPH